jgi:hypothetical protein
VFPFLLSDAILTSMVTVVSLVGVVLIARPPFLFFDEGRGRSGELRREVQEGVTTAQRIMAVGYVRVMFQVVCSFVFDMPVRCIELR